MGEIVNLRQARKARARAGKEAEAQTNRTRYGRTKSEKERDVIERERLARTVDQARLEPDA